MFKFILILSIITTVALATYAQQANEIIGKYHLPNDLDVEIYKDSNTFSGKIIGLNDFKYGITKDINNPDKLKQDAPLLEMVIIHNLEYDNENKQWINGKMYGPEKGMIFNLKITEVGKENIEVVGSKYLFWHTMKWEKI